MLVLLRNQAGTELRLEMIQKHVGVREVRLAKEQIMLSKVEPLQAVLRCEAPERIQTAFAESVA